MAAARKPRRKARRKATLSVRVTPSLLRAEGLVEIGTIPGTQVMFVRTEVKARLFHVHAAEIELANRPLDEYARTLAINWLESGISAQQVSRDLGLNPKHLAKQLASAGYVRMCLNDRGPAEGSTERARERRGRRGSQLVQVGRKSYRFASTT